jgi:D-3-phosphoglycerate dehydrogenase / 2-oxoglutarate reductase
MLKILLTHTPTARQKYYGDRALASLRTLAEVRLHEGDQALSPPELIEAARDVDIIIADRLTTGPAEIFTSLPTLKAFLRCAVDIRNIDVEAASAAGVLVTQATAGFAEAVGELAIGYLVDLSRGVSNMAASYHAGKAPEIPMGRQLSGSTIGIIGYGFIGRYLASIAAALGMSVLVADPYTEVDDKQYAQVSFENLLADSDYVVCLAVATSETENMMDADAFARMKSTAFFLNLARGNLVDESALTDALAKGQIAGAALDVGRAPDQMPTLAVAGLPNVIATPHIGALTPEAVEHQAFDTVAQATALIDGKTPLHTVNLDRWTRRISPSSSARSTPCPMPSHA